MRRSYRYVPAFGLVSLSLIPVAPVLGQTSPAGPHVRTDDAKLRKLIGRGLNESSTFRDTVNQIDQLSGLVYVVASQCGKRSELSACLDHDVRLRGGYRLLRINMVPGEPEARQLPLLAHELQHAFGSAE